MCLFHFSYALKNVTVGKKDLSVVYLCVVCFAHAGIFFLIFPFNYFYFFEPCFVMSSIYLQTILFENCRFDPLSIHMSLCNAKNMNCKLVLCTPNYDTVFELKKKELLLPGTEECNIKQSGFDF